MKTLKQFEKQDKDVEGFLKPLDQIDWELYEHILCGYVPSNFDDGTFGQNGECSFEKNDIRYYTTVGTFNGKYYYLGDMPDFNSPYID